MHPLMNLINLINKISNGLDETSPQPFLAVPNFDSWSLSSTHPDNFYVLGSRILSSFSSPWSNSDSDIQSLSCIFSEMSS